MVLIPVPENVLLVIWRFFSANLASSTFKINLLMVSSIGRPIFSLTCGGQVRWKRIGGFYRQALARFSAQQQLDGGAAESVAASRRCPLPEAMATAPLTAPARYNYCSIIVHGVTLEFCINQI